MSMSRIRPRIIKPSQGPCKKLKSCLGRNDRSPESENEQSNCDEDDKNIQRGLQIRDYRQSLAE